MKRAEKILNKFIKGDIRDYDKGGRKFHITLHTALKAINAALKSKKKK